MSAARTGESTVHPRNIIGHSHVHAASTHMPSLWLLVLATAPIHSLSTIIAALSNRAGCSCHTSSYYIRAHWWSTLQVVLDARIIQARATSTIVDAAFRLLQSSNHTSCLQLVRPTIATGHHLCCSPTLAAVAFHLCWLLIFGSSTHAPIQATKLTCYTNLHQHAGCS